MVMAILDDEQQNTSGNNDTPNLILRKSSTYAEVLSSSDTYLNGEGSDNETYKCSISYEPVDTVDLGSVYDDTVDSVDFGSVYEDSVAIGKASLGCVNFGSVFDNTSDSGSVYEDTVDIGPASLDSVNFESGSTYTDDLSIDKHNSDSVDSDYKSIVIEDSSKTRNQGFTHFCHSEGVPRTKMKSKSSSTFFSGSEEVCMTMRERHHIADLCYMFKTRHQCQLLYGPPRLHSKVTLRAMFESNAGRTQCSTVLLPWMKDLIHLCSNVNVLPGKSFRGIVKVILFLALFSFGFADSDVKCKPRRIVETAGTFYKNTSIELLPHVTSLESLMDVPTIQVSTYRRNFSLARNVKFTFKSWKEQSSDMIETERVFFLFMTTVTIYFVVIGTLLMRITLSDQFFMTGIMKGFSSLMKSFVFRQDNSLEIEIVDGESLAVSKYLLKDHFNLKKWFKDMDVSAVDNEGVKITLHGTPISTTSTQDEHFAVDSLRGSFQSIQDKYSMMKAENDLLQDDEFVVPDTTNNTYFINDGPLYSEEHLIDIRNERVQPYKPSDPETILFQLGSKNEEDENDFDIDNEIEQISKKRRDDNEDDSRTLDNPPKCEHDANEKDCEQYSKKVDTEVNGLQFSKIKIHTKSHECLETFDTHNLRHLRGKRNARNNTSNETQPAAITQTSSSSSFWVPPILPCTSESSALFCEEILNFSQPCGEKKHPGTLAFSVNEIEETLDTVVFIPSGKLPGTSVIEIVENKSDIKNVENKADVKANKLMVKVIVDSCSSTFNNEDVSAAVDNFVTNKTCADKKGSIFKKSKYKVKGEEPRRRYENTDAAYSEQEFERIIMVRDYIWLPLDKLPVPHIDITVGFVQDFPPLMFIIDQIAKGKPPAPHVSMRYELLRFCTLRSYPKEDKPYLIKLAEAGFYYASDGDGVVCYCCGIRRYNWTADDQPMKIHKRINPTCKFILRNEEVNVRNEFNGPFTKSLMALDKIPESVERQEPSEDVNNDWTPERTRSPASRSENNETTSSSNHLGINTAIPKHSQYATKTQRLASFNGWPDTSSHTPDILADAGFFYAGFGDCVRCFYCGIGLRHWTQDDNPWIEHARWAKNCVFVKQKKGEEFVNLVQLAVQYSQDNASEENNGGNQMSPQEIENILLSDAAQSVLDMGYQPRIIKKAIEQIIRQNRQAKITAQFLMEKILEIEEGSNETPGTHVSPAAATSTVGATGITEGATGSSLKESLKKSAELEKKHKDGKPEGKKGTSTKDKKDKEIITPKANNDVSKDKASYDPPLQQDPKAIKAENEQLKEQTLCKICLDHTVSIVFLPCGHLVTCADCAPAMRKCPICRALVKGTVRTYMS